MIVVPCRCLNKCNLVLVICLFVMCNFVLAEDEDDDYISMHHDDDDDPSPVMFEPKFPEETTGAHWKNMAQDFIKKNVAEKKKFNTNVAKNIILFLGDGMSITTLTAARVYAGGEEMQLSFEKFPYVGLTKTYCVDKQVPDSACTATAYLCGAKANYQTIGLTAAVTRGNCSQQADPINRLESILSWAQEAGKATGVVSTARVTHASPAAAYAHAAKRAWENDAKVSQSGENPRDCEDIASQLVNRSPGKDIKVIMGGGRRNFLPKKTIDEEGEKGARKDGQNLIKVWMDEKIKRGKTGTYLWNREQLMELNTTGTDFVLGLFESSHMQYHLDAIDEGLEDQEPTLSDMVEKSLEILQNDGKGYFLFVEGGRIDHAHHSTKAQKALDETLEFAMAVELAVNMTNQEETLIVVTSDHAHTMSFSGYPERGNDILGYAQIANDQIPIVTLSYANGPGYAEHTTRKGRKDVRLLDMLDKDARFPAMVNLKRETHGGQDVAVFARGPWAHLFSGNYEQHFIPHLMAYAACIGNGTKSCDN